MSDFIQKVEKRVLWYALSLKPDQTPFRPGTVVKDAVAMHVAAGGEDKDLQCRLNMKTGLWEVVGLGYAEHYNLACAISMSILNEVEDLIAPAI